MDTSNERNHINSTPESQQKHLLKFDIILSLQDFSVFLPDLDQIKSNNKQS